jgi:ribulose-phosphate 3-epimerase
MSLGTELTQLEKAGIKAIHFDVMDGCFTPMLTIGPPFIKAIKTDLLKDVHLMIKDPDDKAHDYVTAGADAVTVHLEACGDAKRLLCELGKMENANSSGRGVIRGVAVNPGTPVEEVEPLLDEVEMITLLAVDPVAGKNPTMDETRKRAAAVKDMLSGAKKDILLCIDGGVKRGNIGEYATMGADILVSGSALFAGGAVSENAGAMLAAMRR